MTTVGRHRVETAPDREEALGRGAGGGGPEQPWAGTGRLLRLNLRLDRVRIPVWILAVLLTVWGSVEAMVEAYPTPESLQARAGFMANPATVLLTGPAFGLDNYTFGAMTANELSLWLLLAAAIMSIQLAVRHTRAEEEAGRLETVRALPVGRYAPAAAALVTVALADLGVGAATTVALVATGLAPADSVAFGLAVALTGLVFGAVAAVTAQLTEHARAASGLALAVLGAAFLARGVGDVIDDQGSWLSWTSPLAWAQQTRLYVDLRWWPLLLSATAVVVLLAVAVTMARRRDVGAGLRPPSPGPAAAAPALLSAPGLAWRQLRGSFWGWAAGTVFFGLTMGALADSFDEEAMSQIPMLQEWLSADGGAGLTRAFSATLLAMLLVPALCVGVGGALRLRGEEETGRAEAFLVTGAGRVQLLLGWLAVVLVLTAALAVAAGLSLGVGVALVTGDTSWLGELLVAAVTYLPATVLVVAVAVAALGLLPRVAAWTWALVVWIVLVLALGPMLQLPQWVLDTSPFTRTGLVPMDDADPATLAVMTAAAAVLVVVGLLGLRRRDVGRH